MSLVRVDWSAVNYKDGLVARAGKPGGTHLPARPRRRPGRDGGGQRRTRRSRRAPACSPTATTSAWPATAASPPMPGCPPGWAMPLPDGLSARDAMVVGTAGFTAALSVDDLERHGLAPGDGPVLVTGASGGVGSFAVVLLAGRGYDVVASTGKAAGARPGCERSAPPRSSGATISSRTPGRVLGPERWAGAVDCVAGRTLARVLRTLRYGAAVAASGLTGGSALETTVYPFITRDVALLGVDWCTPPTARRRAVWARLGGELRPPDDLESLVGRRGVPRRAWTAPSTRSWPPGCAAGSSSGWPARSAPDPGLRVRRGGGGGGRRRLGEHGRHGHGAAVTRRRRSRSPSSGGRRHWGR